MAFNLKKILKALLFSTNQNLTIKDIQAVISRYHAELDAAKKAAKKRAAQNAETSESAAVLPDQDSSDSGEERQEELEDLMNQVPTLLTATQIREAFDEISAELESNGEVFRLVQSSSGFKFAISPDCAEWVRLLRNEPRPQKLTQAALETLAIIAYRQPVTRAEIEAIRGVNADSAISRLTEKELICITGRADLPGRPLQYGTTEQFMDFVGINSLEELPASDVLSPNQISEWIKNASSPAPNAKDMGLPEAQQSAPVQGGNFSSSEAEGNAQGSGDEELPSESSAQQNSGEDLAESSDRFSSFESGDDNSPTPSE